MANILNCRISRGVTQERLAARCSATGSAYGHRDSVSLAPGHRSLIGTDGLEGAVLGGGRTHPRSRHVPSPKRGSGGSDRDSGDPSADYRPTA